MKRCAAGGIAWSSLATMYQDGSARHAGGPDFSCDATIARGRWVAAISAAFAGGWSAANTSRKALGSMYWSTPPGNGRSRVVDGPRSEPGNRVKMSIWLSPSSVAMAATYTSPFTLGGPTAAFVITIPPYECDKSTAGVGMVASTLFM